MANKRRNDLLDGKMIHVKNDIYKIPYRRNNGLPANKYFVKTKCVICNVTYYRDRTNAKKGGNPICSTPCRRAFMHKPDGTKKYKRGKGFGVILVKNLEHPNNRKGWVPEHRLIIEKKLNRLLDNGECVHHINMIQDDNSTLNLHLFSDNKRHFMCHGSLNTCVKQLLDRGILKFNKRKEIYKVPAHYGRNQTNGKESNRTKR